MTALVSETFYCLLSTVHHHATPAHQQTLLRDPHTLSPLFNLSRSHAQSADPWIRGFHCQGYPADTFALDFVNRHPWFSFSMQLMLVMMFVCFVALGVAMAYEYGPWQHNRVGGGIEARKKKEY